MSGRELYIPWLLALATGTWFGLMAHRAGRNWFLWAFSGALFALVTTTLVLGLGEAAFIPMTVGAHRVFLARAAGVAVLIIVVVGWMVTGSLHGQQARLWKRVTQPPGTAAEMPPASGTESKVQAPKQVTKQAPKRG